MGLIDLFKEFHHDAIQQEFPASARVLFDTLTYKFNAAFWIDSLVFSERDLTKMTGLKKTTLHDAKHYLTSRHLIECKPFKGKTRYSLGDWAQKLLLKGHEMQPTTNRPLADQLPTTSRPLADHPYYHAGEDFKTLDSTTTTTATACAGDTQEIDLLIEYWEQSRFGRLDFELISELELLRKRYGAAEVKAAMDAAKRANGKPQGVSFDFFKAVLENRHKPKQAKQAKKGQVVAVEPKYSIPVDKGDEPWL